MSTDQALLPVAVYGTLRQGQSNHHLLHGKTPLEQGWLEGFQLFDFGSHPAAVRGKSTRAAEAVAAAERDIVLSRIGNLTPAPLVYSKSIALSRNPHRTF